MVFEFGYFCGKLGRSRVCGLYEEGVEIPSELAGVLFIQLDSHDGWQLKLAKEMRKAGLPVDGNRVI